MHLVFENSGELDLKSVTTFGCSVKETSNPIGYFGTGLKYALAVLLRTGHAVVIQSGEKWMLVGTKRETVRGKEFDFVIMGEDDQPTGFTTELGKAWPLWAAYRELYCNAKDEPDSSITIQDELPAPVANKTRIIVSGEQMRLLHLRQSDFILEGKPDFMIGTLEVRRKPSNAFFYKGIKVMDLSLPAMFTYNQTEFLELTEDRTVKDQGMIPYTVARTILEHGEKEFLEKVLLAERGSFEHNLDFYWSNNTPGRDFYPTVKALQTNSLGRVNKSALRMWREKGDGFIAPRRINPNAIQQKQLQRAIDFAEKAGFPLRDQFPIIIVETFGDDNTLAMTDRVGKQIMLSERLFTEQGTKGVCTALIEEYLHLQCNYDDCSRGLQNYLFGKVISLAEQLIGEPL